MNSLCVFLIFLFIEFVAFQTITQLNINKLYLCVWKFAHNSFREEKQNRTHIKSKELFRIIVYDLMMHHNNYIYTHVKYNIIIALLHFISTGHNPIITQN